ncbi:MAG: hypothetical protein DMF83_03560 [Acidobacteria bacterium]|nr:MAG: hypothetical protein DMF83_03560 [Acidobacteriota bacterium]
MTPAGLIFSPRRGTSALLRLGRAVTDPETWHEAYWTAIDEAPASECLSIVARIGNGAGEWRIEPVAVRQDRGSRKTQDVEALARFDGWVYLIGSQYGRPGGPLESRRSFLARFREPEGAPKKAVRMEVVRDRFRLHRAINDALAASGLPLARLREKASRDFIRRTHTLGRRRHKAWADRILPGDLPLNIEGAAFDDQGALLLGLRFPVTASGEPIIVELEEVDGAFRSPGWWPVVQAIRVLSGAGLPDAPMGIRDLELSGDELHVLVGGIDPELVDHAPPPSAHPFEHRVGRWTRGVERASLPTRLVRRFQRGQQVEGLAGDGAGGFAYVAERLPGVDRPAKGRVAVLSLR